MTISNINKTIKCLTQASEIFVYFDKATKSLKSEKFMACIRILTKIKAKPLLLHPKSTTLKKVYNDLYPIINIKIH